MTAVTLLSTVAPIAVGTSSAQSTAPPWEPDPAAATPYSNIVFYDAAGDEVTSGTNLATPFSYAVGTTAADTGANKATLFFALPNHGQPLPVWTQENEAGPTAFHTGLTTAPANIQTAGASNPVVATGTGANIATWLASVTPDTTAGYDNTIEVRLQDSGPGNVGNLGGTTYWETDIGYNNTGSPITVDGTTVPANGWAQLFPFVTTNTTTLTSTVSGTQAPGTPIPLTATVSPVEAGFVQFYDGTTPVGPEETVNGSGVATFTDTDPSGGSNAFTAEFTPSLGTVESNAGTATATFIGGSTSNAVSIDIVVPSSTTVLTSSPSTALVTGQSVTYTATITPTPTGTGNTVDFANAGSASCSAVPVTAGVATCTTSFPTVGTGTYSVTAAYSGNGNLAASTSAPLNQTVNPAATTTVVTSSTPGGTAAINTAVTYTATVAPVSPGTGVPTGTVSFSDGGTPISTCTTQPVNSGTATCTVTYPTSGPHPITATSTGDANYTGSTSAAFTETIVATITTTAETSSVNPSVTGEGVTFTATVTPTPDGGTVTFTDNGGATTLCNAVAVSAGQAVCHVGSFGSAGTQSVKATYSGDASFGSSSFSLTQTINPASTTTTVTSSSSSPVTGESVTYTATIAVTAPGSGNPTGTVAFKDDGTTISTCTAQAVSADTATCAAAPTAGGSQTITAVYSGDANFKTSTSAPFIQTVDPAATSSVVTTSVQDSVTGEPLTYTDTVTVLAPGAGTATGGSVVFKSGGTTICTTTLAAGVATCHNTPLSAGTQNITAVYAGTPSFAASTSAVQGQVVNPASTTSTVSASANPTPIDTDVTFTVTVTPVAPGGGTPQGSVSFFDNVPGISGCSGLPLSAGKATCTTTFTPAQVGVSQSITATYAGSANYNSSTASALDETVNTATVPGSPTGLTAVAGIGQVALTWVAPTSDGGTPVQGYDVLVGKSSGGESVVPVNATLLTGTTYTVTGLTNGTRYYFEVTAVNGVGSSAPSNEASASPAEPTGYLLAGASGTLYNFSSATPSTTTLVPHLNAAIVGIAALPNGSGTWSVGADGGVFTSGDAQFYGSLAGTHLNAPIVGIAATPNGGGYWLVGADGGVFTFGNAKFYGSLGARHLNAPIVGIASSGAGGYWLVGADGGVFTFGDAQFEGSLGGTHLNAPIVGITGAGAGGYWLVGADGGTFAFGSAGFYGSLAGTHLNAPIAAIVATSDLGGYWLIGADGGVFTFGDATFDGSVPGLGLSVRNIVGGA